MLARCTSILARLQRLQRRTSWLEPLCRFAQASKYWLSVICCNTRALFVSTVIKAFIREMRCSFWYSSLSTDTIAHMIFESSLPAREFPQITLYDLLFENNKKFRPDQSCYIDAEDHSQSITFGQVKDVAYKFAAGMQHRFPDFRKGDVVAFYAGNNVSFH